MIEIRKFDTIGKQDHGWLKAGHHFSFGSYYDSKRMGWGPIRVWNDDEIKPQSGFPTHPHQDMEIITYVREGAITHRDSTGNEGRTGAGDVQVMSAGSGIKHSEYNLENEATQLFQIWVLPREKGGEARWDAKEFPKESNDKLSILASGYDDDIDTGALMIRADARLYGTKLGGGDSIAHRIREDRYIYLVASKGRINVNGHILEERDGAAIKEEDEIIITAENDAEFIFVEAA